MLISFIIAVLLSFVTTVLLSKKFIPFLISKKMNQPIYEMGPRWHKSKAGTPTMGGIMFIVAVLVAVLVFGWKDMAAGNYSAILVFVFALLAGSGEERTMWSVLAGLLLLLFPMSFIFHAPDLMYMYGPCCMGIVCDFIALS